MGIDLKSLKKSKLNINCDNKIVFTFFGLGGGGANLAYELSQISSLSNKRTDIVMVDEREVTNEDIVYSKFLKSDIGKNKAEILAKRCSASFNLNMETLKTKINKKEDVLNIFSGRMGYFPVIICNDISSETLKYLKESIDKMSDVLILTGFQENGVGEVNLTYKENGCFKTKNYLNDFKIETSISKNKAAYLEISKNMFLYLDDILSDRDIQTERVLFSTNNKSSISKYIGLEEALKLEKVENPYERIIDCGEDILLVLIGVGGTGGFLAYEISQLASTINKNIKLLFIDGDIVENNNLNRQKFLIEDLNNYKAEVTGNRCKKAYNVDIEILNEYISSEEYVYDIFKKYKNYTPIILGCSDSLKLRYLICSALKKAYDNDNSLNKIIYIDGGNGKEHGQVNFTFIENGNYITKDYFETSPESLEDVFKAKLVTEMSCDELMNSAPQTKGANIASATIMYSYVEDLLKERPINTYITYFTNVNRRMLSKYI